MDIFIIALANIIVGTLVGISGIAGFLLPIIFVGYLKLNLSTALSLSFVSFLTSGIIGSYRYNKSGNLNLHFGIIVSIGSFVAAILGVKLNSMIPLETAKLFLYLVVLLSGLSILIRKNKENNNSESKLLNNKLFIVLFGVITGAICSLSGAGGPILVMPILVSLGMSIRIAIAVSLFDSIFIALPAFIGYLFLAKDETNILLFLIISILFQTIGVLIGTKYSNKINVNVLKKSVAIFSILIAIYMIIGLL
ncbi:sulfite exporter TauE/SafE family protein [uncultured Clostridium sp.]|uniref:sulfite exporter TauE/SafE family protein n=1 Tax=uncultured Clostridium sp. TaxID=59620 RepID=UPI0025D59338|nr:sulfite exporter TauE/SafE family protein [uncultured Clostridium sp.]MDU4883933.1 sulfite exporter TauE/SafE family protein [Clostridium celatum]MDU7077214.1 sulfite exporter TauE/SafE family protein [Clostridium celatum]